MIPWVIVVIAWLAFVFFVLTILRAGKKETPKPWDVDKRDEIE